MKSFSTILVASGALLLCAASALADKEQDLLGVLQSQADAVAKCEACRDLRLAGTVKSVPVLADCLNDARVAHAARYALEGMPYPEATQALREALNKTSGTNKLGIIDSLGWKGDETSVPGLAALLKDKDPAVSSAAASSLGRIGGKQSTDALISARDKISAQVTPALLEALLRCADRMMNGSDLQGAARLYSSLAHPSLPQSIRLAAWRGWVLSDPQGGAVQVKAALASDDAPLHATALKVLRESPNPNLVEDALKQWKSLEPDVQLAVLDGSAKFPEFRSQAIELGAEASAPPVRQAAWMALSELKNISPSVLRGLAREAAGNEPAERDSAHGALLALQGSDVPQMLRTLCESDALLRPELLRVIGERADAGSATLLLNYAAQNGPARAAALDGLRKLGSVETLKPLLALASGSASENDAQPVLEAINAVFQLNRDSKSTAESILSAARSYNETQRGRVLPLLTELGTPDALDLVLQSVRSTNPELRNSALTTAAEWPTAAPAGSLMGIASSASDPVTRVLAMRAAIKVSGHENDPAKRLALLTEGISKSRVEEKRLALSEMGQIATAEALNAVLEQMKNPELVEESALAAVSIAEKLSPNAPAPAAEAAKAVLAAGKAPETVRRARALLAAGSGSQTFIQDWTVCGPFSKPGVVGAEAVFNVAFGPENNEPVQWKAMPRAEHANLLAVFPGQENCAAYLKAQLFVPAACDATLLIGSDDGVKVWLNTRVIHSNNVDRGHVVDQDKVPVRLRAGTNDLLVKVTQGGGGWTLSVRLVGADGGPVQGLKVGVADAPALTPKKRKAKKKAAAAADGAVPVASKLPAKDAYKKVRLTEQFYAEGAYYADFNHDGKLDIVAGPFWFEGPGFEKRHTYRPVKTFRPAEEYSDNFLTYTGDFNDDGWPDILCVPFPGKEGYWYENPAGKELEWKRHMAYEMIGNESPVWGDLLGNGTSQLLLCNEGFLGYIAPDPATPDAPWTFHAISNRDKRYQKFTHGVGFGDINGDNRNDVVEAAGWWEQPARIEEGNPWVWHPFRFADRAAQMYVYDVDGNGRSDVITAWNCHGYGLLWWQQIPGTNGSPEWRQHVILTPTPNVQSPEFRVSQMHAMVLADINRDGILDIVTGKRFWSHGPTGDVEPDAPAVVFWLELQRSGPEGARFIPHLIDDDSGVGTQVAAADSNGDKKPDIIVSNKKGIFVHLSETK